MLPNFLGVGSWPISIIFIITLFMTSCWNGDTGSLKSHIVNAGGNQIFDIDLGIVDFHRFDKKVANKSPNLVQAYELEAI